MNNKRTTKEEVNKLKALCLKMADELSEKYPDKKFTTWDVISKVLSESSGYAVYILTLKADLDVIRLVAEGLSASGVANRLSIPSQRVYEVSDVWGLDVLDSSLDFNPMYVYATGMTSVELMGHMNDILAIPITPIGARCIVNNIEKYYDLLEILEEYEYEKGQV